MAIHFYSTKDDYGCFSNFSPHPVKLNGKKVIDYTEPEGKEGTVKLSHGTFALQAHDPKSVVYFRNIRVKRLP